MPSSYTHICRVLAVGISLQPIDAHWRGPSSAATPAHPRPCMRILFWSNSYSLRETPGGRSLLGSHWSSTQVLINGRHSTHLQKRDQP
ncbi:hypothetical protein OBBRIDRAFT_798412 [Obba rivulosa]|uniref:Uncharacterized protein n=1 Tax=Obba rivulosa TaxID=1052685 RepID=A0A8E2AKT5_9APHY|nr:hypothetical protein OBBRIDRAFT_798412 [Obba rivulosa]